MEERRGGEMKKGEEAEEKRIEKPERTKRNETCTSFSI
jgi:hypothetical protein